MDEKKLMGFCMIFDCEFYNDLETVREKIKLCEGKHSQQVAYSSFHDALTQVCFGCKKIRTSMRRMEYG